jgi:hypothetical protein
MMNLSPCYPFDNLVYESCPYEVGEECRLLFPRAKRVNICQRPSVVHHIHSLIALASGGLGLGIRSG